MNTSRAGARPKSETVLGRHGEHEQERGTRRATANASRGHTPTRESEWRTPPQRVRGMSPLCPMVGSWSEEHLGCLHSPFWPAPLLGRDAPAPRSSSPRCSIRGTRRPPHRFSRNPGCTIAVRVARSLERRVRSPCRPAPTHTARASCARSPSRPRHCRNKNMVGRALKRGFAVSAAPTLLKALTKRTSG